MRQIAVTAAVAAAALLLPTGGIGEGPRPAPAPGPLLAELVEDMSAGRHRQAWSTLLPAHKRVAAQWEYASCERHLPFGRVTDVKVLDVARAVLPVPGSARALPGAFVTLRIRMWPAVEIVHVASAVRAQGGWGWILPPSRFEDYRADRCPADPAA